MERKDRLRRTALKIKERLRKLKSLFNEEPKFDGMLRRLGGQKKPDSSCQIA